MSPDGIVARRRRSAATGSVYWSAVPVLESLAGLHRAGPPPAPPAGQSPLQVIDAIIGKYEGLPNAQLTMARDTDSRSRDWVLRRHGDCR